MCTKVRFLYTWKCTTGLVCTILVSGKQTISNIPTALSFASSIQRYNREVVHMTRTEVVRSEGVVCLSDIGTVGTEDGCWVVLICHIVDEDRVPDIRNEREWRTP